MSSFLFDQILAEWRRCCKLFGSGLYINAFAREIVGDRLAQRRVGNEMRGIGSLRQGASHQLKLPLYAGPDSQELLRARVVDGLIVAELKMQERMVFDCAPIPAVEGVSADEIDSSSNPATGVARHHQQNAVLHLLADDGKKVACKIRSAPFA